MSPDITAKNSISALMSARTHAGGLVAELNLVERFIFNNIHNGQCLDIHSWLYGNCFRFDAFGHALQFAAPKSGARTVPVS